MHSTLLQLLAAVGTLTSTISASPTITTTKHQTAPGSAGEHAMGFIGCSMAENVAQGYVAVDGKHMWGPYGTGGMVVQSWTNPNSASWQLFDKQVAKHGKPTSVWVMVCIFQNPGATYDETKKLIANARLHAAPNATIYITGQPVYPDNPKSCQLAGPDGPELTENLAKQAAADATQNVKYLGPFKLLKGELTDGCHANTVGQKSLGQQALAFWG
ncbi:hypothetical protein B0H63DRAFT_556842 [Podospora didyma]|uniref:Uncharacterized protein n=1 Tax=Podospora didyma TaxID=330526 RepID=A0AAE0U3Q6_9PEZI|nr:hypothetical protein B0H63DRAFT_556842 [Podospora didyma]